MIVKLQAGTTTTQTPAQGSFDLAELDLDVQVTTDPGVGYTTRGCDTSDTCGSTCASACASA